MSQYQPTNSSSLLDLVWHYKFYLAFYILAISFFSFTVLYLVGGVPDELRVLDEQLPVNTIALESTSTPATTAFVQSEPVADEKPEYPVRVIIDKIGVNTTVSNPVSPDVNILNNALMKGAVRYPGSGTLGKGNMFVFGHSTGIRVVNNQAYKAFNDLKQLEVGDIVRIQSVDREYNYKVTAVSLMDSNQAWVTFSNDKNMVTLSTCDVFGQKQDRYVVEATFVKSVALE
jgi:LPXTG-site transpeptidase (sortase) family protein